MKAIQKSLITLALTLPAANRAAPSLSAYIGKYPSDKVASISLYDHPKFKRLVSGAAPNGSIRAAILEGGVEGLVQRQGALLVQQACEPHNCGDHEWVVAILLPDGPAAICYHDSSLTGVTGRWFVGGAPVGSTQGCSQGGRPSVPDGISTRLAKTR